MKNVKKRNWAFVVYPESLPQNWLNLLEESGVQCAISPLHDKDVNADNTIKKPHYHVLLTYENTTTYNAVKDFISKFNGTIPQPLEQVRGYYRYLTHKDNPEKAQYNENDICLINGFNILDYVELTTAEINAIKKELQKIIRDNQIMEYSDLMDYCLDNDLNNAYDVASNKTIFFNTYITSYRNKFLSSVNNLLKKK